MNIQRALQLSTQYLSASSPTASLDAQVILSFILQCNTAHLAAWPEKNLDEEQQTQYLDLIHQRDLGTPVAHLTGQREFWSLNFRVNQSTLIPRPDTETLVEYILTKFDNKATLHLLDMGTGTGAIAISIANEKPAWNITACDLSNDALNLAKENSKTHHTNNISFIRSNWFTTIEQNDFDIIVSNPPYIAIDDPHLRQSDVRFEPESALVSGKVGMDAIEHLCLHAKQHLTSNGCLIVEHGYNQQQLVAECFTKNDFTDIEQKQDFAGHIRMTAGTINTLKNG